MTVGPWGMGYDFQGHRAPGIAKAIAWTTLIGYFVSGVIYLPISGLAGWQKAVDVAALLVLLSFQLLLVSKHARLFRQTRLGYLCLAGQLVLGFGPIFWFQDQYVSSPHFAIGSCLLILHPKWNWLGWTAGVVAMGVVPFIVAKPDTNLFIHVPQSVAATIIVSLVVYGMTTLANAVEAMDAARTEMAKMAVQAERLRFARDLHDLLGYSLSAISLKSELAHRLVEKNPARAQEELTQIIDISRQALADVRSVASGYRELSLEEEATSARSVLVAAEVSVRMDLDLDPNDLPARIRTVLATVLREGVTNILRHSKAERCQVVIRQRGGAATIEITNDGVSQLPEQLAPGTGSGIQNLSSRVSNLDGELKFGVDAQGLYRLRATIPVGRAESDPGRGGDLGNRKVSTHCR